eukprot:scaffold76327_cov33-Tisochrysis_lutea.AAC.3
MHGDWGRNDTFALPRARALHRLRLVLRLSHHSPRCWGCGTHPPSLALAPSSGRLPVAWEEARELVYSFVVLETQSLGIDSTEYRVRAPRFPVGTPYTIYAPGNSRFPPRECHARVQLRTLFDVDVHAVRTC